MENSEINYELLDVMGFDFSKPEDSFINYEREIDNIDFNKLSDRKTSVSKKLELSPELCSILRDILHDLRKITIKIGQEVINIGLRVINFIFKTIELYPHTSCGLLIIACVHALATQIPFFGQLLNSLLIPFDVIILFSAFIKDFISSEAFKKIVNSLSNYISKTTNH